MIPYKPPFDDVYEKAIKPAVEDAGLTATIVKDEHYVGAIFERIQGSIGDAELCVADVTGGNPNVMWEAAYGEALGKQVIFIAQAVDEIPFDVRHNRCILYDVSPTGLANLKREIAQTIRAVLGGQTSDLQTLRQIVLPNSIKGAGSTFVVAANPLSYRLSHGVSPGWRERPVTTFSDYVGIRGLMRTFGMILGVQALPELVNPDDFDDDALRRKMNLYLIGSSKANRWTGVIMEEFFADRQMKWDFRPDPESKDIQSPDVILRCNGKYHAPLGWKETSQFENDFGIVIRGPNPRDSSLMVMVLAGRGALGTEAASLAITDPACIRLLKRELQHRGIDLDDHRQSFLAVVSVRCKGQNARYETGLDTFKVWEVHEC